MTSAQVQWWRRLHDWADVIHADFQTVLSDYLQNISTYLFCTAERMLRPIIMQNSRLIHACFPIKIDEVWIDRFCVRYDWWRQLQPTSSVSPVWYGGRDLGQHWFSNHSGNGLLPDATKSLPKPMLTYHFRSRRPVMLIWGQFRLRYHSHQSLKLAWKLFY